MPAKPNLRSSNVSSAVRRYWRTWRMYIGHRGFCLAAANSLAAVCTASSDCSAVTVDAGAAAARFGAILGGRLARRGLACDGPGLDDVGHGRRRQRIGHAGADGVVGQLHQHAAARLLQRDQAAFGDLLDEVAEGAGAVVALREGGVELQQRALEQAELRRDLAVGQHLQARA